MPHQQVIHVDITYIFLSIPLIIMGGRFFSSPSVILLDPPLPQRLMAEILKKDHFMFFPGHILKMNSYVGSERTNVYGSLCLRTSRTQFTPSLKWNLQKMGKFGKMTHIHKEIEDGQVV